ncbi:ketoacyl-ACP synthase III [Olivibacter sitiensis]|uniref:ketoacyl-ACP synthase III n=1 Tax=Olivibacter sitiensis TaxID=376470 RepID=UPI0003FBDBB2|nr:ketoacyl-ACP synthase III [Olivibacter sitiensis]
MGAKIEAIAYYYPKNTLTNQDLKELYPGYDFQRFEEKVGIKTRYIADEYETALDLAYQASLSLFERIDKDRIDFILYCTQSPEYIIPSTACLLQKRLDFGSHVGAFDFNLGCSGFVYGISMAKAFINSGQAKNVLLVTTDTYSKYVHPHDRSSRSIFGDGAAATLVTSSEVEQIFTFKFGTDGEGHDKLIIRNGATRHKYDQNAEEHHYGRGNVYTDNNLYMNGPEVFRFTSSVIPPFVEKVLAENNMRKKDIDQYVFHQANAYMLNQMRRTLGIDASKFYIDLANGGNTVSSTIPIALKNYSDNCMHKQQETVLICGFGVGLSWAGGVITLDKGI